MSFSIGLVIRRIRDLENMGVGWNAHGNCVLEGEKDGTQLKQF